MRCISGVTFDSYQPAETGMAAAIPRTFHLGHDDPRPSGYRRSGLSTEQRSSASSLVAVYLAQIGRPRAIFLFGLCLYCDRIYFLGCDTALRPFFADRKGFLEFDRKAKPRNLEKPMHI